MAVFTYATVYCNWGKGCLSEGSSVSKYFGWSLRCFEIEPYFRSPIKTQWVAADSPNPKLPSPSANVTLCDKNCHAPLMNAPDTPQDDAPTVGIDDKPTPPVLITDVPTDDNGTRDRQFIFKFSLS